MLLSRCNRRVQQVACYLEMLQQDLGYMLKYTMLEGQAISETSVSKLALVATRKQ